VDVVRPGGDRRWRRPRVVTSNQPCSRPASNGMWICSSVRGCGSIDRTTRFHCVILRTDGRSAGHLWNCVRLFRYTRVAWRRGIILSRHSTRRIDQSRRNWIVRHARSKRTSSCRREKRVAIFAKLISRGFRISSREFKLASRCRH